MEPIVGTHWVVAGRRAEWGLAVEAGNVHLIERISGVWRSIRTWVAPLSSIRDWIKSALIPDLNAELTARYGVAPPAPTPPVEGLAELLGRAISYNETARKFTYIAPADPNNV